MTAGRGPPAAVFEETIRTTRSPRPSCKTNLLLLSIDRYIGNRSTRLRPVPPSLVCVDTSTPNGQQIDWLEVSSARALNLPSSLAACMYRFCVKLVERSPLLRSMTRYATRRAARPTCPTYVSHIFTSRTRAGLASSRFGSAACWCKWLLRTIRRQTPGHPPPDLPRRTIRGPPHMDTRSF